MTTDTVSRVSRRPRELRRATYGLFRVRISDVQRLCPSYVRLTMTAPGLAAFGAGGYDQRIKLLLPKQPFDAYDLPEDDWYSWWTGLDEAVRPAMRTYTVRSFRPATGTTDAEIDVDFVLHGVEHGHAGPASTWAARAVVGDEAVLVGPSSPGTGRMWGVEWAPPPQARTVLLAGDETAVPAVAAILERLPPRMKATVLLEVPHAGDLQDLPSPADLTVNWLPRNGSHAPGELLQSGVQAVTRSLAGAAGPSGDFTDVDLDAGILWEVPENPVASGPEHLYAWLAGEAGVVKALRRHLVKDVGVPRTSVAFMGYWREGRAEND